MIAYPGFADVEHCGNARAMSLKKESRAHLLQRDHDRCHFQIA